MLSRYAFINHELNGACPVNSVFDILENKKNERIQKSS